jgi:hypothetical protein
MDVPVDDGHPLPAPYKGRRRNRDVVDQTEAHRAIGLGVVTRWANNRESNVGVTPFDRRDGRQSGAGSEQRSVPRPLHGIGVGIDRPSAAGAEALQPIEKASAVDSKQFLSRCRPRLDMDGLDIAFHSAFDRGGKPFRSLRVLAGGDVLQT